MINIDEGKTQSFSNLAQIQEVDKPEQPLFYDVPIKIEETSPYDDVRTIYVPIENAINVPDGIFSGAVGVDKNVRTVPLGFNFGKEALRSQTEAVDGSNTQYFGMSI